MSRYRPDPSWLLLGPFIGALAGAVVGAVLMAATVAQAVLQFGENVDEPWTGLLVAATIGLTYGAPVGAIAGEVVGVAFTFLVGAHLSVRVARRRAAWWGAVLPPLTLWAPFAGALDFSSQGFDWLAAGALALAALLGAPLAAWAAGFGADRSDSRVQDVRA